MDAASGNPSATRATIVIKTMVKEETDGRTDGGRRDDDGKETHRSQDTDRGH